MSAANLRKMEALGRRMADYELQHGALPGLTEPAARHVFLRQLVDSRRRVDYVRVMRERAPSPKRADPGEVMFDPLLAAIVKQQEGNTDEACWLAFLFVHFGKHLKAGYQTVRDVYGRLGGPGLWDWRAVSANPSAFRDWLRANRSLIERPGHLHGFGNHRKYESLDADKPSGTGRVVESYVYWVAPYGGHAELFHDACSRAQNDSGLAFDSLYVSMSSVRRFGRLARFEYLAMIGKLGVAPIAPGSAYIESSTGPLKGGRILFGAETLDARAIDRRLVDLDHFLDVGMQALEDAICNWQKSPSAYVRFRG